MVYEVYEVLERWQEKDKYKVWKGEMKNGMINVQLKKYPTSQALNHIFGMGAAVGTILTIQVGTGLLQSFNYIGKEKTAFESIQTTIYNSNYGPLIQQTHAGGASFSFVILYIHVSKYIQLKSSMKKTQISGMMVLISFIIVAFLGYSIVWTTMSYWAAMVITSLVSVLPYGSMIQTAVWGSFTLDQYTLTRMYSMHYVLGLGIVVLAIVHIISLHIYGSSGACSVNVQAEKVAFADYYIIKDSVLILITYPVLVVTYLYEPTLTAEPEMFVALNTMSTPSHIIPEWYLLAYYAVLRAVPQKTLGIVIVMYALVLAIIQ